MIFHSSKNDNFQLISFHNFHIACGYTSLNEAVLTSTLNLCFRAKIDNNVYPCKPNFTIYKWDVRGSTLHGQISLMIRVYRPH